ncbi:Agenet domain-containing protein [Perilla frutescens var. hirtella]|uniref:Agenet domain-containing protein n=1 Tax=Perilla frutescens var. hirtella TaxID=608512 RepID=A0AAD4JC33_PERFH|nr:Agenet domain-containing protein [Perilla frutescens var. hirtella]
MEKIPIKAGQQAEEKSFLTGYRGAWFQCKIRKITTRKGILGYFSEYDEFPDEQVEWRKLYQVPPYCKGNAKQKHKELMLRPQYPPVYNEKQMPDVSEISEVIVIVCNSWKVGDLVDWFYAGCYWSGRITQLFNDQEAQIELKPEPHGEGSSYRVILKDLRPSLDWSHEHGWTLPTQEGDTGHHCARLIIPINQGQEIEVVRQVGSFSRLSYSSPISSNFIVSSEVKETRKIETPKLSQGPTVYEKRKSDRAKSASHGLVGDNSTMKANCAHNEGPMISNKWNNDRDESASYGLGNNNTRKTNCADKDSSHSAGEQAVEFEVAEDDLNCRKFTTNGRGTLNSKRSDTLEASVMDLEEYINKVKWLKRILKYGISSSEDHIPQWLFVEPYGDLEIPKCPNSTNANHNILLLRVPATLLFHRRRPPDQHLFSLTSQQPTTPAPAIQAPSSRAGSSKLAGLLKVLRGPIDRFVNDKGNDEDADGKMTPANVKELRNQVCLDKGRFFYENGISFNCARSASLTNMVHSIGNYGRGLKAPTMYELRTWILNEKEKTTFAFVDEIKATWKKTSVSLLLDVDASYNVKDAQKLFKLLDSVIEEVVEDIVVQVVTDNAAAYKAFIHCIDLMLEKIGQLSQHKNALLKAKKVSNFIHNHQWVLSLFRKSAKKDLLRRAATRFATAYLTFETKGKDVKKIVMKDNTFWPFVVYSIKTKKPLVHVLRIVDGEKTPTMGFIYGVMDEAKETIAKNCDGDLSIYKEIWDIIDEKWDNQLHRDLHVAVYFLNPRYRWSPNVSEHAEIKTSLYKCMERPKHIHEG